MSQTICKTKRSLRLLKNLKDLSFKENGDFNDKITITMNY